MSHEGILLEWVGDGVRFEIEIEDAGKAYVSYANEKSRIDTSWEVRAELYLSRGAAAGHRRPDFGSFHFRHLSTAHGSMGAPPLDAEGAGCTA